MTQEQAPPPPVPQGQLPEQPAPNAGPGGSSAKYEEEQAPPAPDQQGGSYGDYQGGDQQGGGYGDYQGGDQQGGYGGYQDGGQQGGYGDYQGGDQQGGYGDYLSGGPGGDEAYKAGYMDGYNAGGEDGYKAGGQEGYKAGGQEGYKAGYQDGGQEGYDSGYQDGSQEQGDGYGSGGSKGDHGSRGDHGKGYGSKGDHGKKGDHAEKGDHGKKGDHAEKGDHGKKGDHAEKGDHGKKGDHAEKGDHGKKGDHAEKGDHGKKDDKGDKKADKKGKSYDKTFNPSGVRSEVPQPLGVVKFSKEDIENGADTKYDGCLAYTPAGADPDDDKTTKYAAPAPKEMQGPHKEPVFKFPEGKYGYVTKDKRHPGRDVIWMSNDPIYNKEQNEEINNENGDRAYDKQKHSKTEKSDVSTIMNNHYDNFAAASGNKNGIISRDNWEQWANGKGDFKDVQDEAEVAEMRGVAKKVDQRIKAADRMPMRKAVDIFCANGMEDNFKGLDYGNDYEKFEAIATGRATGKWITEETRTAAAKIIYHTLSEGEKGKSASDGDDRQNKNKYGQAQGGLTLFTWLDNGHSHNNDGKINYGTFSKIKTY
jgi:hypothetical protein